MTITIEPWTAYYYLRDHLGSVRVTVDANGNVAGYNDFYPFGETMPGRSMVSSADPRYGYIGKELDVETSYNWFDPGRYYDPWRAGFNAVDPHASLYAWSSPYVYAGDNPTSFLDRTGMDSTDSQNQTNLNQLPPQGPLTLVGPQEIPGGSISANGFSEPPAISRFLGFGSEYLEKVSDVSTVGAVGFIGFGLVTGTEEFTGPIGGGLATFSQATEVGSLVFEGANYLFYRQGDLSTLYAHAFRATAGLIFGVTSWELARTSPLSETQKSLKESLGFALDSFFITGGANPAEANHVPGPVYVLPDATSH